MPKTKITEKAESQAKLLKNDKKKARKRTQKGLKFEKYFTKDLKDPLESVKYTSRSCKIINPDGSVVFELNDIEIPQDWSKIASDILISKYIRKNGVPQYDSNGQEVLDKDGNVKLTSEKSAKQVVRRLAGCWRHWGEKYKYFASERDAQNFQDEAEYMLIKQMAAPNSPQWFNTGLNYAYGITGPAQGHWYADPKSGRLKLSEDAYTHPQPHACFIQSVDDDLVNKGGIFDLITKEARIFKYGSGSGSNFSKLRGTGEPLSGGGTSSGLMSWLQIFDKAAGAIKSGGTTRRASKMVILNADHPDIEEFVLWKHREEQKASALMAAGYGAGFEGESYQTVSGQNSNNSIRVTHDFMKAVENNSDWHLVWRTDPTHIAKTIKARDLWNKIVEGAWSCGDPGLQFDSTVNDWHTCLKSGRINGSNPCSEFMFLDDSSCNLASLNLIKFYDHKTKAFDIEGFKHATRIWTTVLEISVLMAQFPSYEIAKNSYIFRPLGLGYANIGAMLMVMGVPYDSEEGRAISATITSIMTAQAYETSAEMAKNLGPFSSYEDNKDDMLRVIRNHRKAAYNAKKEDFEKLGLIPPETDLKNVSEELVKTSQELWDKALLEGGMHGFRNAQVTLLAPTGTIGLLMDCDTTGIEPDYALVKFKKLAGGGYFKIINNSVPGALENLGYSKTQIQEMIEYIIGSASLNDSPHINRPTLIKKGMSEDLIEKIENELSGAFDLTFAFNKTIISKEAAKKMGIEEGEYEKEDFNFLKAIGFSKEQIDEANESICGIMTIEGAPHLKEEDLPVFDCANKCGKGGKRFIAPEGHVKMMGAVQPFLSGAISKTVNLPNEATLEDVSNIYRKSWELGLKAVAIYRDGSKVSQPLNIEKDKKAQEKEKEVVIEYRPVRKKLPKERQSLTRKVNLGGHKLFLTVGLYEDGKPGELFITMSQQGSFAAGMADSFAKMVSIGLQYGVPVETIISQMRHMRYQPMGFTGDNDITNVSSISDFIAQWFENKFLESSMKAVKLPFGGKEATTTEQVAQAEIAEDKSEQKSIFSQELGFSGETCPECGMASMVTNGKCYKCVNCGATTGCS
ncbi:MAG: Vitamin B12-dependent ribonucleotide reductase [candidate division WS2 bacterium ADurb.Bin280]|uniref:Vitamin B12-dependent ribonucleotide reductase n=1 Tax=candidate division WS2 bacterium ADurb.Bin280 TaxID=1852829 RepID=A0A1V5SFD5_9BACT|nr:MAG: Vitamin B12-dependent ribonucleotide reductase [candidate division WS2 bacterium ADurb.Bin280]